MLVREGGNLYFSIVTGDCGSCNSRDLMSTCWLFGVLFYPEDRENTSLEVSINFYHTTCCHIRENNSFFVVTVERELQISHLMPILYAL
jgi:hypothetical protein